MTHHVAPGSLLARIAPMITVEVTTEPTDRSKPPETSTKTCPAVRIISGVARCRKVRKLSGWKKTGLRKPTQTSRIRAIRYTGFTPRAQRHARALRDSCVAVPAVICVMCLPRIYPQIGQIQQIEEVSRVTS